MALTKVSGGILDPGIDVAGIVTATGFSGPFIGGSNGINAGILTATSLDINGNGNISGNLVIGGNVTANGNFTTLNTTLREVEILHIDADSSEPAGIITQRGSGDILNLFDNNTEVLTVKDGGKVGIGTDTIDGNLHVYNSTAGSVTAAGDANELVLESAANVGMSLLTGATSIARIKFGSPTANNRGVFAYRHDDDAFTFNLAGTEKLRIDSNGRVGIGTDNPTQTLHIYNSSPIIRFTDTDYHSSSSSNINGTNGNLYFDTVNSNRDVIFRGGSTEVARITGDGKVGINSIIPATNLDIRLGAAWIYPDEDGTEAVALKLGKLKGYNTSFNDILVADNDNATTPTYTVTNKINRYIGNWHFDRTSPDGRLNAFKLRSANSGTNLGNRLTIRDLHDTADSVKLWSNGDSFIGVTTDGTSRSLGIGTDTPVTGQNLTINGVSNYKAGIFYKQLNVNQYRFMCEGGTGNVYYDVYGIGGGATGDHVFRTKVSTGAVEALRITESGNIGIGTDNPSGKLHISSRDSGDCELIIEADADNNNENDNSRILFRQDGGSDQSAIGTENNELVLYNGVSGGGIVFKLATSGGYTNATEKVRIDSDGKATFTSEIATAQDYPTTRPTLDLNFAAQKKLDPRITYRRTGVASFVNEFGKVVLVGDNAPRFDYDPTTRESKGLLIEESRTNINVTTTFRRSNVNRFGMNSADEQLSGLNTGGVVSPVGTAEGVARAFFTGSESDPTGTVYVMASTSSSDGALFTTTNTHTASCWIRTGLETVFRMDAHSNYASASAGGSGATISFTFTLTGDGTVTTIESGGIAASVTKYPNNWYRCTATFHRNSTSSVNTGYGVIIYPVNYNTYNTNSQTGDIAWFWGPQMEDGAFPTSYIQNANDGTKGTRGQDLVEITEEEFSEFYNQTEGSFVSEIMLKPSWPLSGYASIMMTFSDNTYNNRITLASSTGSAAFNADVNVGGTNNRASLGSYTSGSHSIKAALAYKASDSAGSINGAAAVTTSPGTLPLLTRADIGKDHQNGNLLNGHIKRIMYYSHRLPNSQLVTLTS